MNISMLGVDIAKNVFQLHGIDKQGKTIYQQRVSREKLVETVSQLPACQLVMEACSGANYWSRRFSRYGHHVKLISPQYVKPFVKRNKNDRNDAQAICEAASRPSMYFVSAKSIEQQDIQSLHRVRERLIGHRTALANQIRGLLAEYGIVIVKGIGKLRTMIPMIVEDAENELTMTMRHVIDDLYQELLAVTKKIINYDHKSTLIFKQSEACQRLEKIEGLGVITTTALVAAIGDAKVFKNGRQLSAWLGLTPRECSSGDKKRLLGISKRGDCYIRKLLVHGARSVIYRAKNKTDARSLWINGVVSRCGQNKASVALANKNMRIAWALLTKETDYKKAV